MEKNIWGPAGLLSVIDNIDPIIIDYFRKLEKEKDKFDLTIFQVYISPYKIPYGILLFLPIN